MKREHVKLVHQSCDKPHCAICDGGLFVCTVCGQAEGELTEECPATVVHELKVWPEQFYELYAGHKTFEFRKDDRNFRIGDELLLRSWHPERQDYLDAEPLTFTVTSILKAPDFGVPAGYCVMSLKKKG